VRPLKTIVSWNPVGSVAARARWVGASGVAGSSRAQATASGSPARKRPRCSPPRSGKTHAGPTAWSRPRSYAGALIRYPTQDHKQYIVGQSSVLLTWRGSGGPAPTPRAAWRRDGCYSTVTLLARLRGLSMGQPRISATW